VTQSTVVRDLSTEPNGSVELPDRIIGKDARDWKQHPPGANRCRLGLTRGKKKEVAITGSLPLLPLPPFRP